MSCDVLTVWAMQIIGNTAGDAPMGRDVATEDHVALAVEQLILSGESVMLQVHAAHLNSQPIPNPPYFMIEIMASCEWLER